MRITSCGITDVGIKRTNNEDAFLINDDLNLFVVCDGMGGHVGGEMASCIAVNTVEEVLASMEALPLGSNAEDTAEATREKLRYAIRLAGKRIYDKANVEPEFKGMGTTVLVLLVQGSQAYVGHVGDSRAYLIRSDTIEQLTEDHSLVNEKVRAGLLTTEEARRHKLRNIITRSLGYQEEVDVDIQVRPVRQDDLFLLCTDGLSNLVDPAEMGETLRTLALQPALKRLVDLACTRGGEDNITTLVTRIEEVS
ncbi:MAG: Stp1/IreP family PP2C-type Ser/Thr phosphatase [Deltaproteobacteria bacterium]|nr:Stp1/IreP family PP2C-type Ser/Thr phosphatase [Deltaproteobacteria bacterium]